MLSSSTRLKNIKHTIIIGITFFLFWALLISPPASAGCPPNPTSTKEAVQCGTSPTGGTPTGQQNIETTIANVVNLLSIIVGIAAVFAIIIAGIMFITAAGDSNRTARARTAVILSLVGLVLVGLAQAIVNFVVERTV